MYEDLDCFETALKHFGTRVDVIIAMEMADKIDSETAYQEIKQELKELKKIRKSWKKIMDKMYDQQRQERLADVVADYLGDEEVSAEKFCTDLTEEVRDWANYHRDQLNKANKVLTHLNVDKIEWSHPESGVSKNKEREYNIREAEYYNKRARLDAISKATNKDWTDFWEGKAPDDEFDMMLSQYGYEYTPKLPDRY